MSARGDGLTAAKVAVYGLPAFFLAVVGIPVYVYLPKFYTDVVGVDIALMGHVLLAARLFDAVTDPLMGWVSDRTRSPFGRRRPYILLGSLALSVSLYQLFTPPADAGSNASYFAVWLVSLFLFWTVITVPYEALGPELTFDYHARTRLFAVRDGLLIAGTLAAAASPMLLRQWFGLPETPAGERRLFFWIAAVYAPLVVLSCWCCVHFLREASGAPGSRGEIRRFSLSSIRRNRPFGILLASYTLSALGSNLPATLILYYVEYVLHSTRADLFLLLYFVTGIVFLPAWTLASRRFGKKSAWLAAMGINTLTFVWVFFLGPGDELYYGLLVVGSGVGFGATLALPSAIQADVIDYDELLTGVRQEGQYVGLWTIAKKLAAAVGVGAGLTVLGWAGYTPGAVQPPEVVTALKILYALVPCLCNLAGFVIALAYPIEPQVHRAIREAVARRQAGEAVEDPLRAGQWIAGTATAARN